MSAPMMHFELWSEDPAKTGEFYARTLGWSVNAMPDAPYWMVDTGGGQGKDGINGGIFKPQGGASGWPGLLCCYAKVDSIAKALERVTANGGSVLVPWTPHGTGAFAIFKDPDGRAMGLWE